MNNSIKTPIVITEAEQKAFARRFKAHMPRTFSGVILHAADALERFNAREYTQVDMSLWHLVKHAEGKEPVCVACLAGAAMISLCDATGFEVGRRLDGDAYAYIGSFAQSAICLGGMGMELHDYESVVNFVRRGELWMACCDFHKNLLGSDVLKKDRNAFDCLNEIEALFADEFDFCRQGNDYDPAEPFQKSPELIGCLRRVAKEVKALGL